MLLQRMSRQSHIDRVTSSNPRAAQQAEGRKSREYKSKVDGMVTVVIPAAFDEMGRGVRLTFEEEDCTCSSGRKKHRWQFHGTVETPPEHHCKDGDDVSSPLCAKETPCR